MNPNKQHQDALSILFVIVDRGKGDKVIHNNEDLGLGFHTILHGNGTADSSVLDLLGLGTTEKDIVICAVKKKEIPLILENLVKTMEFDQPGKGIAFTIPINAISGNTTIEILTYHKEDEHHERKNS